MRKKVTGRRSKEQRFREIESWLQNAGEGGMRVAGVANAIEKSKSYTHKLLLEMVDLDLIERRITYTDTDTFFVNYVYYQLPLFEEYRLGREEDGYSDENRYTGMSPAEARRFELFEDMQDENGY